MEKFDKENYGMNICVCCQKEERKILNFLFEESGEGSIEIQKKIMKLL